MGNSAGLPGDRVLSIFAHMGNIIPERYENHSTAADFMNGVLPFFPDLLEQFMSDCDDAEDWITVQEFRTRMSLDKSSAHAIAGFLQRLHNNPSTPCRYTVARIENVKVDRPVPSDYPALPDPGKTGAQKGVCRENAGTPECFRYYC